MDAPSDANCTPRRRARESRLPYDFRSPKGTRARAEASSVTAQRANRIDHCGAARRDVHDAVSSFSLVPASFHDELHPAPKPLPYTALTPRAERFDSDQFIFELKVDGFRAIAHSEDDQGKLISRNANIFFGHLTANGFYRLSGTSARACQETLCPRRLRPAARHIFRTFRYHRSTRHRRSL
jgi:hypothetical protein